MIWARMLAYITGTVDQELLLRNEYLAAENRILRAQIKGRLLLSDAEKLRWLRSPTGSDGKPWKNGGCREAGYAAGLVPKAHRQQVRRIEVSQILGSSQNWRGNRAVGGADGKGKSRVGL